MTLPSLAVSTAGCSCWARAAGRNKEHAPTDSTTKAKMSRVMLASAYRQAGRKLPLAEILGRTGAKVNATQRKLFQIRVFL